MAEETQSPIEPEYDSGDDSDSSRSSTDSNNSQDGKYTVRCKHRFRRFYFKKPTWCTECKEFIWGTTKKQGYRCKDCNFGIHFECLEAVSQECSQQKLKKLELRKTKGDLMSRMSLSARRRSLPKAPDHELNPTDHESTSSDIPGIVVSPGASNSDRLSIKSESQPSTPISPRVTATTLIRHLTVSSRRASAAPEDQVARRGHLFQVYTFTRPSWCSHCNNFIWGLERQGYRCTGCGLYAHHHCLPRLILPCRKPNEEWELVDDFNEPKPSVRPAVSAPETSLVVEKFGEGWAIEIGRTGQLGIRHSSKDEFPNTDSYELLSLSKDDEEQLAPENSFVVENNAEEDWYKLYFFENPHDIYMIQKDSDVPVIMTIIREEEAKVYQYRIIIWTSEAKNHTVITTEDQVEAWQLLAAVAPEIASFKPKLHSIAPESVKQTLMAIENSFNPTTFAFTAFYAKKNQQYTQQFLNNDGSPAFFEFMKALATPIEMANWTMYHGGLDTSEQTLDGKQSYHTEFFSNQIMFHVAPLLPNTPSPKNPEVTRRQDITLDDTTCVVFADEKGFKFSPGATTSHLQTFILVQREITEENKPIFKVNLVVNENLPFFGPSLPASSVFDDITHLRAFLLAKLINAEKVAFDTEIVRKKRTARVEDLLRSIHTKYHELKRNRTTMRGNILKDFFASLAHDDTQGAARAELLFGAPLADIRKEGDLPAILVRCIEALDARSLDVEGIYRRTAALKDQNRLKFAFVFSKELNLKDDTWTPDMIWGVLKVWLRELPEPLLTFDLYDELVGLVHPNQTPPVVMADLKATLAKIPELNMKVFKYLMLHLRRVADHSNVNLMTPNNLGRVFGPNLIKSKIDSPATLFNLSGNDLIEFCIDHVYELFDLTPPTPPQAIEPSPTLTSLSSTASTATITASVEPEATTSNSDAQE